MKIKINILPFTQKVYKGDTSENQIRILVSIGKESVRLSVGHNIAPEKWDKVTGRVKRGSKNKKNTNAHEINNDINDIENKIRNVISLIESKNITPSIKEFKIYFNNTDEENNLLNKPFDDLFDEFIRDKGKLWTYSSVIKYRTVRNNIKQIYPYLTMNDMSADFMGNLHSELKNKGMQNTTIERFLRFVRTFLIWGESKGYKSDWRDYKPEIKTIKHKAVVFLTWDELMRLYALEFIPEKAHLERVRDVFCFQCFTSLRYSDVAKLQRSDVYEDYISVITEKTNTSLKIDLSERPKAILRKYKGEKFKNNLALPIISNQRMNEWIKECCALAEINEPVKKAYMKGNERIEEVYKKYELISTHSGRRTFISNALIMGIKPEVVMKWTGHTDYKQMQPYIDIADEERKKSISLFDK